MYVYLIFELENEEYVVPFLGSAPPSRAGSRIDLSEIGSGTTLSLTTPTTPQPSPPVSPKRRGTIQVPITLKEINGS